ncbi:hypothetical protein BKA69DRAFT_1096178 [Paraphysoderma sedebokerense]|nr:hypothetical protein BKA69DRAFT_1096178 [Paraphysoderma sedebokerense]
MLDIDHSAARISGISEDISQVVVSSAQYTTLEASLAAKNAECVTLEATLTTFKHEMETATNTITQLLKSQGDLHSLLANAQSQISTLREQQNQLSNNLAESQRLNEQHMFEIQGAQTALRNFQTEAQADIENKKVEILRKEGENKKLKEDIRDYQHQLDNLQREIISYKTRVDELTAHYYESESKNTDATRKIEELESKLHTIMKFPDVSLANVNIEETETDDAELSEMIDANNSRISILESKNNEFRALKVRRASNVSLSSEFKRSAVSSPTLLFDKLPNQSSTHLKIASAPSSRRQSVQADTIAHSEPSLSNNSKLAHWKSSQQTLKDANSFNINGLLKASLNALHSANKVSSGNSRASNRSSFSSRPSSGLRKGSTAVKDTSERKLLKRNFRSTLYF